MMGSPPPHVALLMGLEAEVVVTVGCKDWKLGEGE